MDEPASLLQNGSFETGGALLAPWHFRHDVAASLSVAEDDVVDGLRAATVTVTEASSSPWLVQLQQDGIPLQAGHRYTLSFSARASSTRVIDARLQSPVAPYRSFAYRDVTITPEWGRFELTYVATNDEADVFAGFNLAQAAGTVEIDHVAFVDG